MPSGAGEGKKRQKSAREALATKQGVWKLTHVRPSFLLRRRMALKNALSRLLAWLLCVSVCVWRCFAVFCVETSGFLFFYSNFAFVSMPRPLG